MPKDKPIADQEAEQAVLGGILVSPDKLHEIIELIRPEDFYREAHGRIYQAMLDLSETDTPIDLVSVSAHLKDKGHMEAIGGPSFLAGLSEQVGFAANTKHYAQIIHDKSTLRRLFNAALNIQKDCVNSTGIETISVIEKAQERLAEIAGGAKGKGGKNITKRIRAYAEVTEGNIEVTTMYKSLALVTIGNKKAALMALKRLVEEGLLAKIKPGLYRLIEKDAIRLKLSEAKNMGNEWNIKYPFGWERYFITFPKTVIVVSGVPDAGKTAMLLNIANMNKHLSPIYYWTSEMGELELFDRASGFEDFNETEWDEKIICHERSEKFADVVSLYPNAIHIIDNLELSGDQFKEVAGLIDAIWRSLKKGIVLIGLHKDPGREYPQGATGAVKRARLWIDLVPKKGGGNIASIEKIKNWRDKRTNIKGKKFEFSLVNGCKIVEWE
jgi:replicative DNA helicase